MTTTTLQTNQEILKESIQKAIDGGWNSLLDKRVLFLRVANERYIKLQVDDDGMVGSEHFDIPTVIFNHDFAKALWGEGEDEDLVCQLCGGTKHSDKCGMLNMAFQNSWIQPWQYHLQQMVIAEDPIKYLRENI